MKDGVDTRVTAERKRKKARKEASVSKRETAKLGTMNRVRERWREKKRQVPKKKEKISEPR